MSSRPRLANRPADICDPLSFDVLVDPVRAADGHVYSRATITKFIEATSTLPRAATETPKQVLLLQLRDDVNPDRDSRIADAHRQAPTEFNTNWKPSPWPTQTGFLKEIYDECFCCHTNSFSTIRKKYNCVFCGGVYCYECTGVLVEVLQRKTTREELHNKWLVCCNACFVLGLEQTPPYWQRHKRRPTLEATEVVSNVKILATARDFAFTATAWAAWAFSSTAQWISDRAAGGSAAPANEDDALVVETTTTTAGAHHGATVSQQPRAWQTSLLDDDVPAQGGRPPKFVASEILWAVSPPRQVDPQPQREVSRPPEQPPTPEAKHGNGPPPVADGRPESAQPTTRKEASPKATAPTSVGEGAVGTQPAPPVDRPEPAQPTPPPAVPLATAAAAVPVETAKPATTAAAAQPPLRPAPPPQPSEPLDPMEILNGPMMSYRPAAAPAPAPATAAVSPQQPSPAAAAPSASTHDSTTTPRGIPPAADPSEVPVGPTAVIQQQAAPVVAPSPPRAEEVDPLSCLYDLPRGFSAGTARPVETMPEIAFDQPPPPPPPRPAGEKSEFDRVMEGF